MAKIGIEATKAQLEKAVEVTDGSTLTGENSVALKGTASGDLSVAIRGTASGERSTAINANAGGDYSVVIGGTSANDSAVAIGLGAEATGEQSVAIGLGAEAKQTNAVQIGEGENNTAQTLQFRDYQLLDANGKIPDARMQSTIDGTTKTVTQWLIEVINTIGNKPIQSISIVGNAIRITYTDGTYIDSGNLLATRSKAGFVRLSDEFNVINGKLVLERPFDYTDPEERIVDETAIPVDIIDDLILQCLIDNAVYGDEEQGLTPLSAGQKEAIASLLGYMLYSEAASRIQTAIEIAEGKTATFTLSYATSGNSNFNSQNNSITASSFTDSAGNTITYEDVKVGDIVLVTETDVPDRWVQSIDDQNGTITLYKMETAKVDLTNYALKSYVDNAVATKQDINVTIDNVTKTVTQWLSALNSEVNGISEVITDIEGVVG